MGDMDGEEAIDRIIVYDAATVSDDEPATVLFDTNQHPGGVNAFLGTLEPGNKVKAVVTRKGMKEVGPP